MFTLDSRLTNDTLVLGDFELSRVLLMKDSRYPWCILVPKEADITEIYQLSESQQAQLTKESALLGQQLMTLFKGDSLNVAALGNVVSQLHVHHVIRYQNDATWPGPVWGVGCAEPYTDNALIGIAKKISVSLAGELGFLSKI